MSQPPENWLELDDFAVYGLGRSGRAVANLLVSCGKHVVASDVRPREDFVDELDGLDGRVRRVFGRNAHAGADAVVLSPGLEPGAPPVRQLEDVDCWVVSEIDVAHDACAWRDLDTKFVAITGTDGKTTTTTVCGDVFKAAQRDVAVAGNIGTPLSTVVSQEPAWVVAEVSAFQLWSSRHFSPDVAGFTNIAADHLDYFDEWSSYVEAKRRLLELTDGEGTVVLNADDEHLAQWTGRVRPRSVGAYKLGGRPEGVDLGVWSTDEAIRWSQRHAAGRTEPGESQRLMSRDAWSLPGEHNLQDAMCAAGLGLAAGIQPEAIRQGLTAFDGLPHRIEWCRQWRGIDIYNDSKATNVQSALAGLRSIQAPYVAIVGGVDKGLELEELVEELSDRAVAVVLIGELAGKLDERLAEAGGDELRVDPATSMADAVQRAGELAEQLGAASLALSPAASSFDMYESYEHRGEVFRDCVASLSED